MEILYICNQNPKACKSKHPSCTFSIKDGNTCYHTPHVEFSKNFGKIPDEKTLNDPAIFEHISRKDGWLEEAYIEIRKE